MRKIAAVGALSVLLFMPVSVLAACKSAESACRYEIEAEYFAEEGRLSGEMKVTVPNRSENALSEIPFALYANAFREGAKTPAVSELFAPSVFYDGISYGDMSIEEVTGGASWAVGDDESLLLVRLNDPLYPDESVTLSVRYTLTLPRANYRLGIGESCVNLSCFYPQLPAQNESGFCKYIPSAYGDPFVLDTADFAVTLTLPAGMGVACGGKVTAQEEGGKQIYRYEAAGVRDAAFVLGSFELTSVERCGVQIDYYHFKDETPEETLKAAGDAIETFSDLFCSYPYARYALAETDLGFGGMEYSGFATISSALRREERAEVVVHETAHQWWYSLVGSNQIECAWQDEGLAEYSVALFYEKHPAYGVTYRDAVTTCENACRNYFAVASQLLEKTNTSMSRPVNEFSGDYEYRVLTYDKGVVLLDRLRDTMGDKRFFTGLKNYVKNSAGRLASEYDFISCFSSQEELVLSFTQGKCVI